MTHLTSVYSWNWSQGFRELRPSVGYPAYVEAYSLICFTTMTEKVPQFSPYLIHNTHMPHAAGTYTAYSPYTSCSLWNRDHINIDQHLKHLSWSFLKVVIFLCATILFDRSWGCLYMCACMYANVWQCNDRKPPDNARSRVQMGGPSHLRYH